VTFWCGSGFGFGFVFAYYFISATSFFKDKKS
jgi:hypothetical protein